MNTIQISIKFIKINLSMTPFSSRLKHDITIDAPLIDIAKMIVMSLFITKRKKFYVQ